MALSGDGEHSAGRRSRQRRRAWAPLGCSRGSLPSGGEPEPEPTHEEKPLGQQRSRRRGRLVEQLERQQRGRDQLGQARRAASRRALRRSKNCCSAAANARWSSMTYSSAAAAWSSRAAPRRASTARRSRSSSTAARSGRDSDRRRPTVSSPRRPPLPPATAARQQQRPLHGRVRQPALARPQADTDVSASNRRSSQAERSRSSARCVPPLTKPVARSRPSNSSSNAARPRSSSTSRPPQAGTFRITVPGPRCRQGGHIQAHRAPSRRKAGLQARLRHVQPAAARSPGVSAQSRGEPAVDGRLL